MKVFPLIFPFQGIQLADSALIATSALDAESETLVNQALAALLRGNNTTISIAHRLSTIKRSDSIIVLSSDGRVAQQGSYEKLSQDPNGAFTQLMEWQMSGGETKEGGKGKQGVGDSVDDHEDIMEGMAEEGEGEVEVEEDEEAIKSKASNEASPATVVEVSERP